MRAVQRLLGALLLGEIASDLHVTTQRSAAPQRSEHPAHVEAATILAQVPALVGCPPVLERLAHFLGRDTRRPILRCEHDRLGLSKCLLVRVTEDASRADIP